MKTLATVLFISTLPYSCCFLWNVWVLRGGLRKPAQKPRKQSQNVRINCDICCACSAPAKNTPSLHRREASIQQHKVIVWKSIVAQWSAYWQSPQLDSKSKEVRALFLPCTYSTEELLIQDPLYFLGDFMNIPRQWIGLLIWALQLNLRQRQIIQTD